MVARRYLADAITSCRNLRMLLSHFKNEIGQVFSDAPRYAGTGLIGEIVPPIAATSLRANVGSPSLVGNLFVADAWYLVLSRFLSANSTVLDVGCGCGKMARTLVYHPYILRYIGFDVIRENINWCEHSIVPLSKGRFEFHYLDVFSRAYNPAGNIKATDVVFPVVDGAVDFAIAGSLFTHLLQEDAKHYLREVRRVLAPGGIFLPSIHTSTSSGSEYSGDENRIDADSEYFVNLAQTAGLRLVERLGALCGQETFLFAVS
jgi:SAM-dependent methyltransferase